MRTSGISSSRAISQKSFTVLLIFVVIWQTTQLCIPRRPTYDSVDSSKVAESARADTRNETIIRQ